MIARINVLDHPSIPFSSMNPDQVSHYKQILENISKDDIKLDRVESRHRLLLNMGLAGDSPLSDEYFYVRGVLHEIFTALRDEYKKTSYYHLYVDRFQAEANKQVFDKYGWKF